MTNPQAGLDVSSHFSTGKVKDSEKYERAVGGRVLHRLDTVGCDEFVLALCLELAFYLHDQA